MCAYYVCSSISITGKIILLAWYEPRHDKTNKMSVRQAKTQISLGIRPVCSEYSLCAQWIVKAPSFLHAESEDSDQTGRMSRLIWVFAGRTLTLLVLSRGGSYHNWASKLRWHFGTSFIRTNLLRSQRSHKLCTDSVPCVDASLIHIKLLKHLLMRIQIACQLNCGSSSLD